MRTFLHVLGHIGAVALQVLNIIVPGLEGPEKAVVAGAIGAAQLAAAIKARYKNPDGTPATVAWVKK